MADETDAKEFFTRYGVADLPRFSDLDKKLYQAFGLQRGGLVQLFGLKNFKRGFEAKSHGIGIPVGDVWQMPGVFLIHQGKVLREFVHENAGDRPDYQHLAEIPQK